jgi:hypothetical protein
MSTGAGVIKVFLGWSRGNCNLASFRGVFFNIEKQRRGKRGNSRQFAGTLIAEFQSLPNY